MVCKPEVATCMGELCCTGLTFKTNCCPLIQRFQKISEKIEVSMSGSLRWSGLVKL